MTETLNTRAPVLRLKNVHRTYHTGEGSLTVLKGANLDLRPGEMTALVGPSGSGKSTLLHTAGLLEYPDEGVVEIEGIDAQSLSDGARVHTLSTLASRS